jgi:3'-5' exoribonuclease
MIEAIYRKRVYCTDLKVGDDVHEVFCVARLERREGRSGAFLRLTLADRSGNLPGIAWDDVERLLEVLVEGGYARIRGRLDTYKGGPQIRVEAAETVVERLDPTDFLLRGPVPGEESVARLRGLVATMRDSDLRRLVLAFLDDRAFARAFAEAPAAKTNHHAYVGGLAEHTLSVMRLCERAAHHYEGLDRDLLLAGAFFHDIGKVRELAVEPGFPYTEEGALLGHIALGYALVRERIAALGGFPEVRSTDLGHLILSHQGELEWGSPVQPQTIEALVLHYLDNLDSKVATARAHMAGVESGRTAYVRALGRALFRRAAPGAAPLPGEGSEPSGERPEPPADTSVGPETREERPPSLFDQGGVDP